MKINTIRTPYDANALHDKLQLEIGGAKRENLDVAMTNEVQIHNVFAACDSFKFNQDLKAWWLPESRWNLLIRQYLNPTAVDFWINSIAEKLTKRGRGIAVLRTNTVARQGNTGGRYTWRRWGACILSISYRNNPAPQITMHSRSCYMGFLSILDINVAYQLAELICWTLDNGMTPADMSFVWHIESMQMHAWKSLPLFYSMPDHFGLSDLEDAPYVEGRDSIAVRNAKKVLADYTRRDEAGELYGEMKYAQTAYPRRRWHTEVFGYEYAQQFEGGTGGVNQTKACKPLPHLLSESLSLDPIYSYSKQKGDHLEDELASNLVELVME